MNRGLKFAFLQHPRPGIKGAARPGFRAISPIRISIARPVAIWPCANNTFFAFLLRTMSSGATPCSGVAFIIWLGAEPCKDTLLARAEGKCDYPILDLYYTLWPETLLVHLRKKCQTTIAGLSDEKAHQQVAFPWIGGKSMSFLELLLYNMRHVQEHAAQLNLFLGQNAIAGASDWVPRAKADEGGE
jgi:hypothetical protein